MWYEVDKQNLKTVVTEVVIVAVAEAASHLKKQLSS